MKKQYRTIDINASELCIREAEDGKESRIVEGKAVVFGVRSVNLVPWSSYREVYEIMEPGSITQELINRSDVVLTAFHDNTRILGRSVNGSGTLTLTLRKDCLWIRCEIANTTAGNDVLEMIRRGDVKGMSFAFTADEDDNENGVSYERTQEVGEGNKEVWLRHVKRCNGLYDVTIAGHPAYQQTSVANRELGEEIEKFLSKELDDAAKHEKEEREAFERAETEWRERQAWALTHFCRY